MVVFNISLNSLVFSLKSWLDFVNIFRQEYFIGGTQYVLLHHSTKHIMVGCPSLLKPTFISRFRCCQPVLLLPSSLLCSYLILVSVEESCLYLDIGLFSLGFARWQFSNSVILPAFITWNSSVKNFVSSTIWLPWSTVHIDRKILVSLPNFNFQSNEWMPSNLQLVTYGILKKQLWTFKKFILYVSIHLSHLCFWCSNFPIWGQ